MDGILFTVHPQGGCAAACPRSGRSLRSPLLFAVPEASGLGGAPPVHRRAASTLAALLSPVVLLAPTARQGLRRTEELPLSVRASSSRTPTSKRYAHPSDPASRTSRARLPIEVLRAWQWQRAALAWLDLARAVACLL